MIMDTIKPIAVKQSKAIALMGVSEATFMRWKKKGIVSGKKVGGTVLYAYEELERLVNQASKGLIDGNAGQTK